MADVFVLGALHWDVVVDAPRLPGLDETLIGSHVAYRFGGKGGNQALAAARMGAKVAMAGRVGSDAAAGSVLAALDAARVDRRQVRATEGATGMSVAITEPGGEYAAVVVSGVNREIDPGEVDPGDAALIVLQNEIPEAVNLAIAARRHGARILLNAAPARPTDPRLLALTDVLVVNRVEAAQMTGRDPRTLDAAAAADELAGMGAATVLVTTGAEGGAVRMAGRTFRIAPPVRAAGSAHGAGDAFVGALAAELARGAPMDRAAEFAAAAAAHFVATPPEARGALTRRALEAWRAAL